MGLKDLSAQQKASVIKKWFAILIETYPADTVQFLKNQQDPFANPVGRTILRSLEPLFDELLGGMDHKKLASFLDPIIRIRAVQNFSPQQAVGFVFDLKKVIRAKLHKEINAAEVINELLIFESRIDELGLVAFNLYMQCREKIYELKANEMRNRTFRAFERAGLVSDIPEVEPVLKPINITEEASNNS